MKPSTIFTATISTLVFFLVLPVIIPMFAQNPEQTYTGTITQLTFEYQHYNPMTVIYFEDGTVIDLYGHVSGLIVGKTYTITCSGNTLVGFVEVGA